MPQTLTSWMALLGLVHLLVYTAVHVAFGAVDEAEAVVEAVLGSVMATAAFKAVFAHYILRRFDSTASVSINSSKAVLTGLGVLSLLHSVLWWSPVSSSTALLPSLACVPLAFISFSGVQRRIRVQSLGLVVFASAAAAFSRCSNVLVQQHLVSVDAFFKVSTSAALYASLQAFLGPSSSSPPPPPLLTVSAAYTTLFASEFAASVSVSFLLLLFTGLPRLLLLLHHHRLLLLLLLLASLVRAVLFAVVLPLFLLHADAVSAGLTAAVSTCLFLSLSSLLLHTPYAFLVTLASVVAVVAALVYSIGVPVYKSSSASASSSSSSASSSSSKSLRRSPRSLSPTSAGLLAVSVLTICISAALFASRTRLPFDLSPHLPGHASFGVSSSVSASKPPLRVAVCLAGRTSVAVLARTKASLRYNVVDALAAASHVSLLSSVSGSNDTDARLHLRLQLQQEFGATPTETQQTPVPPQTPSPLAQCRTPIDVDAYRTRMAAFSACFSSGSGYDVVVVARADTVFIDAMALSNVFDDKVLLSGDDDGFDTRFAVVPKPHFEAFAEAGAALHRLGCADVDEATFTSSDYDDDGVGALLGVWLASKGVDTRHVSALAVPLDLASAQPNCATSTGKSHRRRCRAFFHTDV